jgi:actin-related protein
MSVVVDIGSQTAKSGFSEDKLPISITNTKTDTIKSGIISNFEEYEKILNFIFTSELKVKPEEQPILLSECTINPRNIREKITEIMFENFNAPSFYLIPSSLLSMYSVGVNTGIVVESGLGVTHVFSSHDGYGVKDCFRCLPIAGIDVTNHLMKKLGTSHELSNEIKEKFCFVRNDEKDEKIEKIFQLPDGKSIQLGNELFESPEILFKKNSDCLSLPQEVFEVIHRCPQELKNEMKENILICGGNSMFKGMKERMDSEIKTLNSKTIDVKAPKDRKYSAWIGGSILASLSTFQSMWVSSTDYEESGPGIVHRKCYLSS